MQDLQEILMKLKRYINFANTFSVKTLTKKQLILQYGTSAGDGVVYEDVYIKD